MSRYFVDREADPAATHLNMARALDRVVAGIRDIQSQARAARVAARVASGPRWSCIRPKGWTGPALVDGAPVEDTWRAHQVPLAGIAENPEHLQQLESWMRSYRPEELFTTAGRLKPELRALAPAGRATHER